MSESLQDQLRALGLAKKGKKDTRPERRNAPKRRKAGKGSGNSGEVSLDKAYALRRNEEQKQADIARRKKQAEDRQRREINEAIRRIVKQHRLNDEKAEIARHFMFRSRIRKIYVTPEQQKALGSGELGIVYLSGGYHLLPPEILDSVRRISADHVVDLSQGSDEEEEKFPVPDDLTW
jgi:uncharacterized protein YaiL (DUF2058 family)